jgi:hypothetical protein
MYWHMRPEVFSKTVTRWPSAAEASAPVSSAQGWLLQVLVPLAPALAADDVAPTRGVAVAVVLAEQAAKPASVSAAMPAQVIEAARFRIAL